MYPILQNSVRSRVLTSRLGSLLLLFQRSPLVQMIFPEVKIIGGAGLGEITKWSIATVAGLGAFDSVAGATTIAQIAPSAGSSTVTGNKGESLTFVFQLINYPDTPGSWKVTGLPPGLKHADAKSNSIDSISGIPNKSGKFPVTLTAYSRSSYSGDSFSKTFTLNILPPIPDIGVEQPEGKAMFDGRGGRNLGSAQVGAFGRTMSFTITNTGKARLSGIMLARKGPNFPDFVVTPPAKSLFPGDTTTFTVTFKPSAAGTRSADLIVRSNDPDEKGFNIKLSGLGTP